MMMSAIDDECVLLPTCTSFLPAVHNTFYPKSYNSLNYLIIHNTFSRLMLLSKQSSLCCELGPREQDDVCNDLIL